MAKAPVQKATQIDCIKGLSVLPKKAKLIIADPPYNFGQPYDAYADNKSYDEYMSWTHSWLKAANMALDATGSMWIFCPDEWVSEIDIACRKSYRLYKRRHVIWAFTFGQKANKNFTRSHCHLLWMSKSNKSYTFNFKDVKVPSARQLVYNDKRAVTGGKPPDATWMLLKDQLEPYMTPDKDTWLMSRICGTFKERKKHSPNQLPVPLLERIVLACSNKGDLVVDPFAGTGSSGVACALHGRSWEGFDLSKLCVNASNKRIAETLT
jgi:site-specific DNA-methyltransferase (adenine-specific)